MPQWSHIKTIATRTQELSDHLPLYDPPCIIAVFAWDLGKSKSENISFKKCAHTELFDKQPWTKLTREFRLCRLAFSKYSEKFLLVLFLKLLHRSCWICRCSTNLRRKINDLRISCLAGVDNERKREMKNELTSANTPFVSSEVECFLQWCGGE